MDDLIPCVGTLGIVLIVFGFIGLMRYISYRETMGLAEKGLVRPDRRGANGKDTLRWGIVITAVGVALSVGLYPIGFWIDTAGQLPLRFGPWMLVGLLPMFFGLGLILVWVVTHEDARASGPDVVEREPGGPPQVGP